MFRQIHRSRRCRISSSRGRPIRESDDRRRLLAGRTRPPISDGAGRAVGVDPKTVNFVSYDGGGDLLTALLGNKIAAGTSGPGEFIDQIEAGQLRVLAVSSGERIEGVDAPTLKEAGIDLTFTNWRGILAPPGISDEAKQAMVKVLEELHGTPAVEGGAGKERLDRRVSRPVREFEQFLKDQDNRVSSTLTDLGLL